MEREKNGGITWNFSSLDPFSESSSPTYRHPFRKAQAQGLRMWVILAQGYLFLAIKREATGLLIKEGARNKRELYYYFGLSFVEHMEASFRSEGRTPISEFRSYAIFALGVRVRTNYRKTHSILYRLFKKNRMSGLNALFRSVIPP